ncbi:Uncharacterised protein [uncultured archaeon]|nr:Uncharacterised protein [uncultured archaeon]
MAEKAEIRKKIAKPIEAVFGNLDANLFEENWPVLHKDEFVDEAGKRIKIIYGVTTILGGAPLLQSLLWGGLIMGQSSFFIKIKERKSNECDLLIVAGGFGAYRADYGRNEAIAEKIVGFAAKDD